MQVCTLGKKNEYFGKCKVCNSEFSGEYDISKHLKRDVHQKCMDTENGQKLVENAKVR